MSSEKHTIQKLKNSSKKRFSKRLSQVQLKKFFLGILFIKHKNFLLKIFSVRRRRFSQGFLKSTPATNFFIIFFLILIFLPMTNISAAINKQINYQGKLTTSAGVAVADGTYNMEFALYTVASAGTAIWTETRTTTNKVQVTSGLFSVLLGEVTSLAGVDFNQTLYLGVNIGGTGTPGWDGEMTPRKKLGAVPAAVVSESAINIIGGVAGAVPYQSAASTTLFSAAGTTGQAFISGGTGSPTWFAPTVGSILFAGASGILSQDNANFFWDDTNNRLGIGTTAPGNILDVQKAGADTQILVTESSDSGSGVALSLRRSRGTSLSSPTATQSGNYIGAVNFQGYGTSYQTGAQVQSISAELWSATARGTDLFFSTNAKTTTTLSERMRITSEGNVGIGTTAPSDKLEVVGSSGSGITISGGNTGILFKNVAGAYSTQILANTPANGFSIYTGSGIGALGIVQDANGNVGIGTTSPLYPLHVEKSQSGDALVRFENTNATGDGLYLQVADDAYNAFRIFNAADAQAFVVKGSGNVTTAGTLTVSGTGNSSIAGNVGIGTTAPTEKLQVNGNIKISYGNYILGDRVDGYVAYLMYVNAAHQLSLGASNINGIIIGSTIPLTIPNGTFAVGYTSAGSGVAAFNGNVGIGTTSPGSALDIIAPNGAVGAIIRRTASSSGNLLEVRPQTGDLAFYINDNGHVGLASNRYINFGASQYVMSGGTSMFDFRGSSFTNWTGLIGAGSLALGGSPSGFAAGQLATTSANATGTTISSSLSVSANSLTTGTGIYAASSSLTSGLLVNLQVSGTAAAASQTALNILTTGATATNAITTYGAQISNTHTNVTSGTNVALYLNASGATTANYGLIVENGNVGIGTTAPGARLDIASYATSGTTAYGLQVAAPTGATNNYAANFTGGPVAIGTSVDYKGFNLSVHTAPDINWGIGTGLNITGAVRFAAGNDAALANIPMELNATQFSFGAVGAERVRIDTSGNVGIGETAPGSKLSVLGGAAIGSTTAFSQAAIASGNLAIEGNVGIGTTEPGVKLEVVGHCVTSDTLLPIRRRRKKKNGQEENSTAGNFGKEPNPENDSDWEYLMIPITDIQSGDEVLSLNKNKGLVEYHPIKGLMDMGVQDVYELKTKSGRVIRTTSTHPYLTKIMDEKLGIINEKKLTNEEKVVEKNAKNEQKYSANSQEEVKISESREKIAVQNREIENLPSPLQGEGRGEVNKKEPLEKENKLLKNAKNLLTSFSEDSKQNESNGEQSSKNININHVIKNVTHKIYSLTNDKLNNQNTIDNNKPDTTMNQSVSLVNNELINTEAKNICPISEEISESLETLESDNENVGNSKFIPPNDTPNEDILSRNTLEIPPDKGEMPEAEGVLPIRNARMAELCPYCLSKNFVKRGTRKNKNQVVQLYVCRNEECGRTFTATDVKGKHYPLHLIIESMSYYNLGFSLEETCRIIKKKFGVAPESATLSDWINEYKPLCRYERLRSYANKLFSPKEMVEVVTMAHRQLYRFRYHRAKTILMLEEFRNRALAPLKNYLDNVSSETPHQYFQDGERMSEIKSKFDKADMIVRGKQNFANRLTAFVLQSIPDNKQRHEELQRFMLANDSCTVATEVPVYIRREDVEHLENELKFKISDDNMIQMKGDKQPRRLPKLLTGHIDIIQIRNGQIHLLDYKPNASKERPIEQLTWYALAMSRLTGLRIFNFTCAWFDEKDYYQFYPLHVVKKLSGTKKRRVRYRSGEIVEVPRKNELVITRNRGPDKGG